MAVTIRTTESLPDAYPAPPEGLTDAAGALDADMIWQRIEMYTAWRWTERDVVWIVEGEGEEWLPPLAPATIATTEVWTGSSWAAVTLAPSPLGGYVLPGAGPYRFAGTLGDDEADIPAAVLEAFRRIAEYMADTDETDRAGARSLTTAVPDVHSTTIERSPAWMAQALVNSGAADLLRQYRRV